MKDLIERPPGPWTIEVDAGVHHVNDATGTWVCECMGNAAHLIAAAPDLLDALRDITNAAEHCGDGDAPVTVRAFAAIAKAEGRS